MATQGRWKLNHLSILIRLQRWGRKTLQNTKRYEVRVAKYHASGCGAAIRSEKMSDVISNTLAFALPESVSEGCETDAVVDTVADKLAVAEVTTLAETPGDVSNQPLLDMLLHALRGLSRDTRRTLSNAEAKKLLDTLIDRESMAEVETFGDTMGQCGRIRLLLK